MKRKRKAVTVAVCVILVLGIITLIVFPPSKGEVSAYKDANGNTPDGSFAEKVFVDVDGFQIGAILLGQNKENPVLMICGGGPGIPQYLVEYLYPSVLSEYFTVCYWDYRGTGLSFDSAIDPEEMTTERYITDALAVTDYLCERFGQEKIYIMGHSFGTYLALETVSQYPDKFIAYIAMSQVCNQKQSEYLAYDYMRDRYVQADNSKMVKRFDECPIRESDEMYEKYFSSSLRDKAMHELGVGTTRDMKSVISGLFFPSLRCTSYTQRERINLWRGKANSKEFEVTKESINFNAFNDIKTIDIPIYFIVGKYDCTCMASLQEEYYVVIGAPKKELYLFENSAHSPLYEEPERARQVLEEILNH